MPLRMRKSLAVSLLLHGAAFAAAAWAVSHLLPRHSTSPIDETPPIVISEGDNAADPRTALAGSPKMDAVPTPPKLPQASAKWPNAQPVAAATPTASLPTITLHPTHLESPHPHAHAAPLTPTANETDAPDAITTGNGAAPSPDGGSGSTPTGNVASLSTGGGANGAGNAWGNGPPIPLAGNAGPLYPPIEQRNGVGGVVRLLLTVTEPGLVQKVVVADSSGSTRLDAAALAAVKKWRFQSVGNGPSVINVQQEVHFSP